LKGKIKNYKNFGEKKAKGKEKEIKSRTKLKKNITYTN